MSLCFVQSSLFEIRTLFAFLALFSLKTTLFAARNQFVCVFVLTTSEFNVFTFAFLRKTKQKVRTTPA